MTPLAVGVAEGAAALGISKWSFRQLIASGDIPTVQLPSSKHSGETGRRVLVAVADLEEFVKQHRSGATS